MITIITLCKKINQNKPKFCINCKHFLIDNTSIEFSRCSLFPIIEEDHNFLVTGISEKKEVEYNHCSITRSWDNYCGVNGKMYKRKYSKKFSENSVEVFHKPQTQEKKTKMVRDLGKIKSDGVFRKLQTPSAPLTGQALQGSDEEENISNELMALKLIQEVEEKLFKKSNEEILPKYNFNIKNIKNIRKNNEFTEKDF